MMDHTAKRALALLLGLSLLLAAIPAGAEETVFTPRAQAVLSAERALEETWGLTPQMLCYFARSMAEKDGVWTLTYTGVEVFTCALGEYTVTVSPGGTSCAWSWEGTEPQGFAAAPWGSAQLKEITDYVRANASYSPYYQMAQAINRSRGVTGEEVWGDFGLPESDGSSIAPPGDAQAKVEALRAQAKAAAVRLWGIGEEQAVQFTDEDYEPEFRRIDGRDCVVFIFHFGTRTGDKVMLEDAHPEWLSLVGDYIIALSLEDGAVTDLRYDAELLGNG